MFIGSNRGAVLKAQNGSTLHCFETENLIITRLRLFLLMKRIRTKEWLNGN